MSIDEDLSIWFISKYIRKCAQLCPVNILRLFDDVSSAVELQHAVSEIVVWRLNTSMHDLWQLFFLSEYTIAFNASVLPLTARSCAYWTNELTKIEKRLAVYFSAVALFYVARNISRNGLSDVDMAMLSPLLIRESSIDFSLHKTELNTTELVELLHRSAVECLTKYRQILAQDFGSLATIVTTDFEALYAYKHGDYQRCLQLSTQNVRTLLYANLMPSVSTLPVFIQLLDDDIVSLTALTLIINPMCRRLSNYNVCISQLTLSLYLMTQCHLKLHHSVTSLAQTLHYIKVAQTRHDDICTLNHLTLKLIERKVYLTT